MSPSTVPGASGYTPTAPAKACEEDGADLVVSGSRGYGSVRLVVPRPSGEQGGE